MTTHHLRQTGSVGEGGDKVDLRRPPVIREGVKQQRAYGLWWRWRISLDLRTQRSTPPPPFFTCAASEGTWHDKSWTESLRGAGHARFVNSARLTMATHTPGRSRLTLRMPGSVQVVL